MTLETWNVDKTFGIGQDNWFTAGRLSATYSPTANKQVEIGLCFEDPNEAGDGNQDGEDDHLFDCLSARFQLGSTKNFDLHDRWVLAKDVTQNAEYALDAVVMSEPVDPSETPEEISSGQDWIAPWTGLT